jgi:hypothetical protein
MVARSTGVHNLFRDYHQPAVPARADRLHFYANR